MNLVSRYIKRPHLVLSFVFLVSLVGIMGYKKMPFNLFPDTDRPQISVVTVMPGAAAGDVETDITRVIEKEVSSIDLMRKVTSTSKDEVSVVLAEFEYQKGLDSAATDVANALSKVAARLPQGIRPPQIFKISQATQPTMTLALSPKQGYPVDLRKIRELADNQIKEELLRTHDVGNVEVFGGHQPEVLVSVQPDYLSRFGIAITDVMAAISAQNQNIPQGIIVRKEGQYLFKTEGSTTRIGQLADLVIARRDTGVVHLRDLARITSAEQERQSAYHGNGKEAIGINILRTESGHTLDPILAVEASLPRLKAAYPFINFETSHTQKDLINTSVDNMLGALREAVIVTILVIFLFLGNLRAMGLCASRSPASGLIALDRPGRFLHRISHHHSYLRPVYPAGRPGG
jgi:multidrug efflux pump subunit AcrB